MGLTEDRNAALRAQAAALRDVAAALRAIVNELARRNDAATTSDARGDGDGPVFPGPGAV